MEQTLITEFHSDDRQAVTSDERSIEKMLDVGLSLRDKLAEIPAADRPNFWLSVVLNVETKLAKNPSELRLVRERLRQRGDDNGRALAAYADALLDHYCQTDIQTAQPPQLH